MNTSDEIYTTESLSKDFENDFLKKNSQGVSFSGGNGVWKVKINRSFQQFKSEIKEYGNSRVYMHFNDIELLENHTIGTVLVSLLGC